MLIIVLSSLASCGENSEETEKNLTCSFQITCEQALNEEPKLKKIFADTPFADGKIYFNKQQAFLKGQSVFDILLDITKEQQIQMEFAKGPYTAPYIEGIANLYEFDGGANYGWMYKVNGETPNISCGKYYPKQNDVIVFEYGEALKIN